MRRFLFLTGLLFVLCGLGIGSAALLTNHLPPYYNCLSFGDTTVRLNGDVSELYSRTLSHSPNGRYALNLVRTPDGSQLIVLENTQTRRRTVLQRGIRAIYGHTWASNSQALDYIWVDDSTHYHRTIYSVDEKQNLFQEDVSEGQILYGFSADVQYLAVQSTQANAVPSLLALRTGHKQVLEPIITSARGTTNYAWSPTGHRFAYADREQLIIADPETNTVEQIQYVPEAADYIYIDRLAWSADNQSLLIQVRLTASDRDDLFVMTPTHQITRIPIPILPSGSFQLVVAAWINNQLIYFRPTAEALAAPSLPPGVERYEMWLFDPAAGEQRLLLSDVANFSISPDRIALLRQQGTSLELWDDLHPYHVQPVANMEACNWLFNQSAIVACVHNQSKITMTFYTAAGSLIWDTPEDAEVIRLPIKASENRRFVALLMRQDDQQWLEIVDLDNAQSYRFPSDLQHNLTEDIFDVRVKGYFEVSPSPTSDFWLVQIGFSSFFRFWSDTNRWEVLHQDGTMRYFSVLWSPDGQRFAFFQEEALQIPDLLVQDAASNQVWNLGAFSAYTDLTWTQCGGITARLSGE